MSGRKSSAPRGEREESPQRDEIGASPSESSGGSTRSPSPSSTTSSDRSRSLRNKRTRKERSDETDGSFALDGKKYRSTPEGLFVLSKEGEWLHLYQPQDRYAWHDECGVSQSTRFQIVGGEDAIPHEFPWMVSIRIDPATSHDRHHWCGAVIVHPEYLLTAAHCMDGFWPGLLQAVVGQHDGGDRQENSYRVNFEEIIMHEDYAWDTYDNDISLVKLAETLSFTTNVSAICAPDPDRSYEGETSTLAGWGTTRNGGINIPAILQKSSMDVLGNTDCQAVLDAGGQDDEIVTDNMLCTGVSPYNQTDTCSADSGGPVMFQSLSDGVYELIGLVSWGVGCAQGFPGVNTRITQFIDWVSENMGQ